MQWVMRRKEFFEKFIKSEQLTSNSSNPLFWSRETKMFGQLIKKYGSDFFQQLSIGFKLNSLAFFRSVKGKQLLLEKHNQYIFDIKNKPITPPILLNEKVGEDKIVVRKPKSILDFIR